MKHLIIIFIAMIASLTAAAQTGLNVDALFDGRYRDNKSAVETIIKGEQLRKYDLSTYHSLTLADMPEAAAEIEQLVEKDGARAISREVSYRQGHLYYGFYQLPPYKGLSRHLFYLNQNLNKGNKIMLIYLDGIATTEFVKKLLK